MTFACRLHGLTVESDRMLHGAVQVEPTGHRDLSISTGEPRPVPHERPDGQLLGVLTVEDTLRHVAVRRPDGRVVFRVPGLVEFVIGSGHRDVTVHHDPNADPGLVHVLTDGALIAAVLELNGALTLHASAVRTAGRGIAISGPTNSGKTTIAGLLCAGGAGLVADDLLHADVAEQQVRAWPGGFELRIRERAAALTSMLVGRERDTADGRIGVVPDVVDPTEPVPLDLVVLPRLHRRAGQPVEVTEVTKSDALIQLLAAPRLLGWSAPDLTRVRFEQLSHLLTQVPVVALHLPWGQAFETAFADRVGEALTERLA